MFNPHSRPQVLTGGNPIANAIVVIVGVLALALSLVLGFVAFVALGSLFLVLGAIIAIRLWWAQRKFRRQARRSGQDDSPGDRRGPDVIEGEYRVIRMRTRDRDR